MKTSGTISKPGFKDKEVFNMIRLRKAWTNAASEVKMKYDRLRQDYGDSRTNSPEEKRKWFSEGLKICR